MQYEFLLLMQAFLFVIMVGAYMKRDEKLWLGGAILAGIISVNSYAINMHGVKEVIQDSGLGTLNMAFILICTAWAFVDIWGNYGGPLKMMRALKKKKELAPDA